MFLVFCILILVKLVGRVSGEYKLFMYKKFILLKVKYYRCFFDINYLLGYI